MYPSPRPKPMIKVTIQAGVYKKKKLVKLYPEIPANSLICAFLKLLKVQISTAAETIKDVANADHSISQNAANFQSTGTAGDQDNGVVVGSGTTTPTMTDYKLQTQLKTNVAYGAVGFALESPDAATYALAIARSFTNNTGATLGIREVGLYSKGLTYIHCTDRTLYSVDVPAGLSVTFTYRIYIML